jgi:hypothetical protein
MTRCLKVLVGLDRSERKDRYKLEIGVAACPFRLNFVFSVMVVTLSWNAWPVASGLP